MTDGRAEIHSENPFETPPAERPPERRFRGRLPAPVTIWTSGDEASPAGLTVSSLLLAEGEPSLILGLINDTTDLWDRIEEFKTFAVHLLHENDARLAERFAGLRPSPGGLFEGLDLTPSDFGPLLTDHPDRALCRFVGATNEGYHRLVRGEIKEITLGGGEPPLTHYRGRFHRLDADG